MGKSVVRVLLLGIVLLAAASQPAAARNSHAPTSGASAFVRVNQVGYPATARKQAFVMASAAETGATFTLWNGSTASLTGSLGSSVGSWSTAYPDVYAIDFSAVATAGSYHITVSGPVAASSPTFAIGTGPAVYGGALHNALTFYQNERDGSNFVQSPLRPAAAHVNDQSAMTYSTPAANSSGRFSGDLSALGVRIDASGGWWDAGDYLKFVQTTNYTDGVLLAGVRDLPSQMGAGSGSDFTAEAKFGADFLLRMWDDSSRTLYYQVGIGEGNAKTIGDHDIWRLPQADDAFGGTDPLYRYIRNRPVFRAGPGGSPISPNLAGRDAAALAECYVVFKTSDPAFANRCITAAVHIYDLANTSPGQLLTVIPYSFYPETEWRDDLEWGATELYFALASGGVPSVLTTHTASYYLQQAAHWSNAYITGPEDAADTLNLYDVSGLAHYDLYRAIGQAGNPAGLETSQAALLADLKKQLDGAVARAAGDAFGFGFPWAAFDTTSHGFGLSVMASEYDQLTGTTAYAAQSARWIANVLGANAWGISLAVGDGSTFPHCMQHQLANLAGSLDGSPPVLAGAVVEGPNKTTSKGLVSGMRACPANGVDVFAPFNATATFADNVQSWSTDEPAIDLSATSPLAFARQAAGLN
ncbi:MAG TPA: glycoside hydrolase family 9 protein [Kofleriaceae bacterium]|jgi:endoglucanase